MNSNELLSGISLLIVAYGGIFVLTGLLPFVATFLFDGVVQLLRHNGLRYFLLALGITVVVAAFGLLLYQYGISSPAVTSVSLASLTILGGWFLTFSVPLAVIAFLFRTGKLLLRNRRAA
ncbi:hypothetical protein [Glaciibacter sp. 2TAF33]|uniref:hypothetical protein n=1 Tax=Glaciibacter sp. 2TAF33 TaxID=3233015 RepID=UPI003F8FE9F3